MKINFTKAEYRTLLQMLDVANAVASADPTEEEEIAGAFEQLSQKIMASAKEMGAGELVEYDEAADYYSFTDEFEAQGMSEEVLEAYRETALYTGLARKLALRDMERQHGEKAVADLPIAAFFKLADRYSEAYIKEFSENDFNNLKLAEGEPPFFPLPNAEEIAAANQELPHLEEMEKLMGQLTDETKP